VVVTAFDLGVGLGGDPIVFIGADLAYTGGQPYCRGTVYEEDWDLRLAHGESLEDIWRGDVARHPAVVETHEGEPVATARHLTQFRDALLHAARSTASTVVNATGAGILRGEGIESGTLSQIFEGRSPVTRRPLPQRRLGPPIVETLRQAVRDLQSAASLPDEWMAILNEHEPPDPTLPAQLAAIVAQLSA
jgi:hypothetical protein